MTPSTQTIERWNKLVRRSRMPQLINPEVFVVDDEEVIASTLTAILNLSGYSATAFTNPLKALKSAKEKCPDVLISDD